MDAALDETVFIMKRTNETKNEFNKINHKGHKEHIGREARTIKSLRPLRTLRSDHPQGTAIAVPLFVTFAFFAVKSLLPLVTASPR